MNSTVCIHGVVNEYRCSVLNVDDNGCVKILAKEKVPTPIESCSHFKIVCATNWDSSI